MKYERMMKLTPEQVRAIRNELRWFYSVRELAKKFNVNRTVIYRIIHGYSYKEIK